MRGRIIYIALLCCSGKVFAQSGFSEKPFETTIEVFDANGRPFANPAIDIAGSPFFTDEWKYATVLLNSNKEIENIKLRLNLQTQEIHFLSKNVTEMAIPAGVVKEVRFYNSPGDAKPLAEFQCGFPAIDNQNANSFYQVLSSGKVPFLCSLRKSVSEQKDGLSGEIKKEFVEYEDYYVFAGGAMTRVKKDKAFVINLLKDKEDQVKAFMAEKKFRFKSFDDITQIIAYYNSLP
jgi:hypothetical protein